MTLSQNRAPRFTRSNFNFPSLSKVVRRLLIISPIVPASIVFLINIISHYERSQGVLHERSSET